MLPCGVNLQASHPGIAVLIFGQHSPDSSFDDPFRMLLEGLRSEGSFKSTGITAVVDILFLGPLVAGKVDLDAVEDNNEVARILVKIVLWLVLAYQYSSDLCG